LALREVLGHFQRRLGNAQQGRELRDHKRRPLIGRRVERLPGNQCLQRARQQGGKIGRKKFPLGLRHRIGEARWQRRAGSEILEGCPRRVELPHVGRVLEKRLTRERLPGDRIGNHDHGVAA
jgi:hypothetical protein